MYRRIFNPKLISSIFFRLSSQRVYTDVNKAFDTGDDSSLIKNLWNILGDDFIGNIFLVFSKTGWFGNIFKLKIFLHYI